HTFIPHCPLSFFLFIVFISPHYYFLNHSSTSSIYTLSLLAALPICSTCSVKKPDRASCGAARRAPHACVWEFEPAAFRRNAGRRSEEHTSELQSRFDLVCRLPLDKKNYSLFTILYSL